MRARPVLATIVLLGLCLGLAVPVPAAEEVQASPVQVSGLEVDGAVAPLGIDNPDPRLSWRLDAAHRGVLQRGYRVLVATSPDRLHPGATDVWDSGLVDSADPFADFAGEALESRTQYAWTVQVRDEAGRLSGWAAPSSFETAFMDEGEWQADWIAGPERERPEGGDGILDDATMLADGEFCRPVGPPGALPLLLYEEARRELLLESPGACRAVRPAPLLRREFPVDRVVERARVYVSGLAYADVYLNGEQLGDGAVLDPGFTDYAERVLYLTYDVTDRLRQGDNVVGVELGSGWFDYDVLSEWFWTKVGWRGDPRLRLELHIDYADGTTETVRSDESWQYDEGPTRYDNINIGETYDARFAQPGWNEPDFDMAEWSEVRLVDAPAGRLVAQTHESIAVIGVREPVAMSQPRPGVHVFDMGEQMTGWAELSVDLPAPGTAAEVSYGEVLLPDGTVDLTRNLHIGDKLQTDFFVSDGSGAEDWRPRFSYKGFRYVQVSGPLTTPLAGTVEDLRVQVVRSAVAATGELRTDNDLVNAIFTINRNAIANNLHGLVTDTPTFEKNGWMGDAQVTTPTQATFFDMHRFSTKWMADMRDAQLESGEVPVIVPTSDHYGYTGVGWDQVWGATPVWDAAMFVIPWETYLRYGDERLLADTYDAMRLYLDDWVGQWVEDGAVTTGLGDWNDGGGGNQTALTETAYYAYMIRITADAARVLGHAGDAARYDELFGDVRTAFNDRFLESDGTYGDSQVGQLLPLAFDLAPGDLRDSIAQAVVDDVEDRGGTLSTGIAGTRWLFHELTDAGHFETAFTVATQTDNPSYGEWVELGHTSMNESWGTPIRSFNHHMLGSVGAWFFEGLAGLAPAAPGYAEIAFVPGVPSEGLTEAAATYESVRGEVATSWRVTDGGFELDVTVPANAAGVVHVPAEAPSEVAEIGQALRQPAETAEAVELAGVEDGRVVYRVGSGSYRFRVGETIPTAEVVRIAGPTRVETAVAVSQDAFSMAVAAVLARTDAHPDALAASTLAAQVGGPVLLTPSDRLHPAVAEELRRLGVAEAYLAGGTGALSEDVEAELRALGITPLRLDGGDRFDTAALVAGEVERLGGALSHVIVALGQHPDPGRSWPDALAAGNLAAVGRAPVLLTHPDRLPEVTTAALEDLLPDGATVWVVGGPAAAGDRVVGELAEAGYEVRRLAGSDRFETAVEVVEEARRQGGGVDPVFLASGRDWPDALGAAVAATAQHGALLLVDPARLDASPPTRDWLETVAPTWTVVVGGPAAVSEQVADDLAAQMRR